MKAVLFDLDNTLYPQREFICQGMFLAAQKIQRDLQLSYTSEELHQILMKLYDDNQRVELFNTLFKLIDSPLNSEEANKYIESVIVMYYRMVPRRLHVYDGVIDLLLWLKMNGIRIGCVTQGHSINQWNKIFALGIESYFDSIVISGQYPDLKAKPAKDLFELCVRQLHVDASEAVFIGDDIHLDGGCLEAGIKFILVHSEYSISDCAADIKMMIDEKVLNH